MTKTLEVYTQLIFTGISTDIIGISTDIYRYLVLSNRLELNLSMSDLTGMLGPTAIYSSMCEYG